MATASGAARDDYPFDQWQRSIELAKRCNYCDTERLLPLHVKRHFLTTRHWQTYRNSLQIRPGAGLVPFGLDYNCSLPKLYLDGEEVNPSYPLIIYAPTEKEHEVHRFELRNDFSSQEQLVVRKLEVGSSGRPEMEKMFKGSRMVIEPTFDADFIWSTISPKIGDNIMPGGSCAFQLRFKDTNAVPESKLFLSYIRIVVSRSRIVDAKTGQVQSIEPPFDLLFPVAVVVPEVRRIPNGLRIRLQGETSDSQYQSVWSSESVTALDVENKRVIITISAKENNLTMPTEGVEIWELGSDDALVGKPITKESRKHTLTEFAVEIPVITTYEGQKIRLFAVIRLVIEGKSFYVYVKATLGNYSSFPKKVYDALPANVKQQVDVLPMISYREIVPVSMENYFDFHSKDVANKVGRFTMSPETAAALLLLRNPTIIEHPETSKYFEREGIQEELQQIKASLRGDDPFQRLEALQRLEEFDRRIRNRESYSDLGVRLSLGIPKMKIPRTGFAACQESPEEEEIPTYKIEYTDIPRCRQALRRVRAGLLLHAEYPDNNEWYKGVVYEIHDDGILIGCDIEPPFDLDKLTFTVESSYNDLSDRFIYRALKQDVCRRMYWSHMYPPDTTNDTREPVLDEAIAGSTNEKQQALIRSVLRASTSRTIMEHGPPGTGKTFTLGKAALAITSKVPDENHDLNRVLAVATTNRAADKLALEFLEQGISADKLVRVQSVSRDASLIPDAIRTVSGTDGLNIDPAQQSRIKNAVVVVTTVDLSGGFFTMANKIGDFTHVIIDETSQLTEQQFLVVLSAVAQRMGKVYRTVRTRQGPKREPIGSRLVVVIAGDTKQLPPVLFSVGQFPGLAIDTGSVLTKLSDRFPEYNPYGERSDPALCSALSTYYRGDRRLMAFLNRTQYNNQLDLDSHSRHPEPGVINWLIRTLDPKNGQVDHPVRFVHLKRRDYERKENEFIPSAAREREMNWAEIDLIRFLVGSALAEIPGLTESDIGILTFYGAQVTMIREALSNFGRPSVKVDTAEAWQGQEKPIMIVSCVRSGDDTVGFTGNEKRVTTALSRAIYLNIVVGDAHVFAQSGFWRLFLQHCANENILREQLLLPGGKRDFQRMDPRSAGLSEVVPSALAAASSQRTGSGAGVGRGLDTDTCPQMGPRVSVGRGRGRGRGTPGAVTPGSSKK